jgi:hypothetical protein
LNHHFFIPSPIHFPFFTAFDHRFLHIQFLLFIVDLPVSRKLTPTLRSTPACVSTSPTANGRPVDAIGTFGGGILTSDFLIIDFLALAFLTIGIFDFGDVFRIRYVM